MRAARVKPLVPSSAPATAGPQLLPPRETVSTQASEEMTYREDPHPFFTVLIVAVIAFTLAFTFFSTVTMWVWFRNSGVDWMFQRS
jgi:hypothetical protein